MKISSSTMHCQRIDGIPWPVVLTSLLSISRRGWRRLTWLLSLGLWSRCGVIAQSFVWDDSIDGILLTGDGALPSPPQQFLISCQLLNSKSYVRTLIHARGWRADIMCISIQGDRRNLGLWSLTASDIQRSRMRRHRPDGQCHL